MKSNAIIRIILFSLAILVLASLMLGGIGFGSYLTNLDKDYSYKENQLVNFGEVAPVGSFDPQDIRNIEIDWAAGSIRIVSSPDVKEITVSETYVSNQNYRMTYTNLGNTLEIQFDNQKLYLGISYDHSKDLVIEVPADWTCNELEIDTASAYVDIQNLTIGKVDFDGASGVCNFTNCTVEKLDMDTASGDVNFLGQLNMLDCDAASANCKIDVSNQPYSIKIDSASGGLDLTLPDNSGFTCKLDTLSGDFTSDFETIPQGNRLYRHGDGKCQIDVSGLSGDVIIRKSSSCSDPNCTETYHNHH